MCLRQLVEGICKVRQGNGQPLSSSYSFHPPRLVPPVLSCHPLPQCQALQSKYIFDPRFYVKSSGIWQESNLRQALMDHLNLLLQQILEGAGFLIGSQIPPLISLGQAFDM